MTTVVKRRGGTTNEHDLFVGASREITVDTDKKTVVVHDGVTPGGFALAREDLSNVTRATVFHGFRMDENGSLFLDTGDGNFKAEDYIDWFLAGTNISFEINNNGELIANL